MSSEQNERPSAPPLCANSCGFYGNPANRNLCSKCYREFMKAEDGQPAASLCCSLSSDIIDGQPCSPEDPEGAECAVASPARIPANAAGAVGSKGSVVTREGVIPPPPASGVETPTEEAPATDSEDVLRAENGGASAAGDLEITATAQGSDFPKGKSSSRCRQCNRKVGLLGFQCRCGFFFCGEHRYADAHGCGFDYKTFEREQLKKQNNRVVAEKLQRL